MQVMPQAPNLDMNAFAPDVMKQFQVAQAGVLLGEQLKDLQNKQAARELEAAQIDALKSKNKLEKMQIEHAQQNLPVMVQQQLAQAQAQIAAAERQRIFDQAAVSVNLPQTQVDLAKQVTGNELAGATALGAAKVPQTMAAAQAQGAENALAGATADKGFSAQSTPQKLQQVEAAKAVGSWGVPSGTADDMSGVPPIFRESKEVEEIDPLTGNTFQRIDIIDKRSGKTITKGEPRLLKLGADEKSVAASTKDATGLIQTKSLAEALEKKLDAYIKSGSGGLGQAIASNAANAAPDGIISVVKKAIGAKAQSQETVEISGAIANLKNTIAHELFGSALSKQESENLQAMLPTSEDLADPKRAKEKLLSTKSFLEAKLKPYRDRGILEKAGLEKGPAAAAPVAPTQTVSPAMQVLQSGGTVLYKGVPHRLGKDPATGKPALVPAQ
jgi:hypothetical protein